MKSVCKVATKITHKREGLSSILGAARQGLVFATLKSGAGTPIESAEQKLLARLVGACLSLLLKTVTKSRQTNYLKETIY